MVRNRLLVISIFLVWLCACSGYSLTGGPGPLVKKDLTTISHREFNPLRLNVVSVFPLIDGTSKHLPEERLSTLTKALVRSFDLKTSLEVINASKPRIVNRALSELPSGSKTLQAKAGAFAKKMGAQGVLYGVINRDQSGPTSDSSGARAGFKLWLMDVKNSLVVWSATFEHTNKPLTDNVFQVQSLYDDGILYQSVDKLFSTGFAKAALELEALRNTQPGVHMGAVK